MMRGEGAKDHPPSPWLPGTEGGLRLGGWGVQRGSMKKDAGGLREEAMSHPFLVIRGKKAATCRVQGGVHLLQTLEP